jgi:hypothetical protein
LFESAANGLDLRELGHAGIAGLGSAPGPQALTSSLSAKLLVLMPPSEPL